MINCQNEMQYGVLMKNFFVFFRKLILEKKLLFCFYHFATLFFFINGGKGGRH